MQKFAKLEKSTRPAPERPVQIWTYILSFLPFLDHLRAIAVSKVLRLAGASRQSWPAEVHFQDKEMSYEMLNTLCELPQLRALSIMLQVHGQLSISTSVQACMRKLSRLERLSISPHFVDGDGDRRLPVGDWTSLTSFEFKGIWETSDAYAMSDWYSLPPQLKHLSLTSGLQPRTLVAPSAFVQLESYSVNVRGNSFSCANIPVAPNLVQLRIVGNGASIGLDTLVAWYTPKLERLFLVSEDAPILNVGTPTADLMRLQLRILQAPSLFQGKMLLEFSNVASVSC